LKGIRFLLPQEKDTETMVNIFVLIKDYLFDQEDLIRHLITWSLNLSIEEKYLLQSGAKRYAIIDFRKASGNSYKLQNLRTKCGELKLSKSRFREFPFEKDVLEKYSGVEKVILIDVAKSYLQCKVEHSHLKK
jgi:putative transposase